MFEKFRKSGITKRTTESLVLNAAVLYKGLTYDKATKKWNGTLLGATSGGTNVIINGIYQEIEVDGAIVKVVGLTQKQGEEGKIEANLIEFTPENINMAIVGRMTESDVEGYSLVETKALLQEKDYLENIAAVGTLSNGKNIIVIMENMLCTSGLEIKTENKKNAVLKVVFECHASFEDDHDTLPIKIYYPNAGNMSAGYTTEQLSAMTVAQIEELATQLGYTLSGSTKDEKITAFLEQQAAAGGNE